MLKINKNTFLNKSEVREMQNCDTLSSHQHSMHIFNAEPRSNSQLYVHLFHWLINPLKCISSIKGQVAQDRNPGPGYNTLLLLLILGDLYSACPNGQFHTGTLHHFYTFGLHCTANSKPNDKVSSRETVYTNFTLVFGMNRPGCEPMTIRGGHSNY